jgi:hypothetical protein
MPEREIRIFLRPSIIIQTLSKVSIKCGIHGARTEDNLHSAIMPIKQIHSIFIKFPGYSLRKKETKTDKDVRQQSR